MKTISAKHRKSELKTGVHRVTISALSYARNAVGDIMKYNGFPAIIIQYKNKLGVHDQFYIIDKGKRQHYFDKALDSAKVIREAGKPPKKEDILGKELYIAIQEIHYVCDDKVLKEGDEPIIEYQIFKTIPISEGIIPKLHGDPLLNNGIASDDFVTYINKNDNFVESEELDDEAPTFIDE